MSVKFIAKRLIRRAVGHVVNWGVNSALFWGITAIFFGGIIHIAVIMSLPYLTTHDAWARLKPITPVNTMVPIPIKNGIAPLPLMTTDMRYAICRYDVSKGTLVIQADLLDDYWSIAIYTRNAQNFYVINGKDVRRSQVELLLSTTFKSAGPATEKAQDRGADDGAIRVKAIDSQGLVVVRAPLLGAAFARRAEQGLKRALCSLQHNTDAPLPQ